jgi:DNA-binding response OmpR family regulator/serine phosphatase RsbU (regulator of sigma subunit)
MTKNILLFSQDNLIISILRHFFIKQQFEILTIYDNISDFILKQSNNFTCFIIDIEWNNELNFNNLIDFLDKKRISNKIIILYNDESEISNIESKKKYIFFKRNLAEIDDIIEIIKSIKNEETSELIEFSEIEKSHQNSLELEQLTSDAKIFLADDSRQIRKYVSNLLTERNCIIKSFENGQLLLDFLHEGNSCDLIILDNQMPVKDGLTTLMEIKNHTIYSKIPVLFLSAITDKDQVVKALELGADDYIQKPFHNNEFFARLNVHLKIDRMKKELMQKNEQITIQKNNIQEKLEEITLQKEEIEIQKEEIEYQKNMVETAYENVALLSEIGKKITGTLSLEKIINLAYENISNLIEADVFSIGIFNEQNNSLDFTGAREKGEILPFFSFNLNEKNRLAVNCFNKQIEIYTNDYEKEYESFVSNQIKPLVGKATESIIYLPLFSKILKLGVISIQSYNKNSFTYNHFNIFKNIAVYTSIAIENSSSYTEIQQKNTQITTQKNEIEKKSKHITDSIYYALRIQKAVLPNENNINNFLTDYFILYNPRDIVSGDFYYIKENNNSIAIVAADCTGHGVPGAFMSMLGSAFINEIISRTEINSAANVLDILRSQVKSSLQQTGKIDEQKDGMDLALCLIDKNTLQIQYSGAYNSIYIIRNKLKITTEVINYIDNNKNINLYNNESNNNYSIIEFKANRQPIGIHIKEKPFENITFQLQKNDCLYTFSDGYQDQFGGQKNEKYSAVRFKNLLLSICDKSMKTQKEILEQNFSQWKANSHQVDDVLVIGLNVDFKV